MSREERAKAYAEDVVRNALWSDIEFQSDAIMAVCDFTQAYLQGAKDAEDNPAWRMCKDELPDKPCECVCHDGERMFFAEWVDDTPQGLSGWNINGLMTQPIAWLPLRKFNTKTEKE